MLGASKNKAEAYRIYVEHLFLYSDNASLPHIFKNKPRAGNEPALKKYLLTFLNHNIRRIMLSFKKPSGA